MSKMMRFLGIAVVAIALTACGEDSLVTTDTTAPSKTGGAGAGGGPGAGSSQSGTPHTIAVSSPLTKAISNLGGGFYSRIGKVIVTDKDGNPAPVGTVVNFNIIDTIIAQGVINSENGDSISASILTDLGMTLGGGVIIPGGGFTGAYAIRNNAFHFLNEGQADSLLLTFAEEEDKYRKISTVNSNFLEVTSPYYNDYPSGPYVTGMTGYVAGASLLGVKVGGFDADGVSTSQATTDEDGLVTFKVTYPANSDTILTGCYYSDIENNIFSLDSRSEPTGSAETFLIAQVAGYPDVVLVVKDFCFSSISPSSLDPFPTVLSKVEDITILVRDASESAGGDNIPLPFVPVKASVAATVGDPIILVNDIVLTDEYGVATFNFTLDPNVAAGDTATITFSIRNFDPNAATTSVKFTQPLNAPPALAVP